MKSSQAIAVASLFLNLTLFVIVAKRTAVEAPAVSQPSISPPRVPTRVIIETVTNTQAILLPGKVIKGDWRMIEASDYKEYIARLRGIGCPEETIRDIIIADVNKLYARKWRSLLIPASGLKYWESWDRYEERSNPHLAKQRQALEMEKRVVIRELLGVDVDQERRKLELHWTWLDREDHLMDFLPADKRSKVAALRASSREQVRAITERAGGKLNTEDRAQIARIRSEEAAEMHKAMSKEEYDQYVLRVSATANTVRSSLIGFDPSEKEYQAIFWAQTSFNNTTRNPTGNPQDADHLKKRGEAAKAMDDQVHAALGDDRYAEYVKTKDSTYRDLFRFAQQMDLAKEVAGKAYGVRRLAESRALKVVSDLNLAPEQRAAALQAIQTETQNAFRQLMGPETYQSYYASRGYWIHALGHQPIRR